RRRRGNQLDLAALGFEPTNLVGSLGGEPQYAGLIEVERVRVLHRRVGHFVFGDVTGLRIELANQAGTIAGEPDIAVLILGEAVWTGAGGLQGILLHLAGLSVEAAELVGQLSRP